MNGKVKCVENQGRNNECMHVKCKSFITVMWNNFVGIKFIYTIWRPPYMDFFINSIIVTNRFFYKQCCYTINERVQKNGFVFFLESKRVC
jgi:hypothetical protein